MCCLKVPYFPSVGDGPNTVSENTVSNTKLGEFLGPHRVPDRERELSEFLLAFVCQNELTEFFAELAEFAAEFSEFFLSLSLLKQYSLNSIPPIS